MNLEVELTEKYSKLQEIENSHECGIGEKTQ